MKDSLSVVKKRVLKNADLTIIDGVVMYLEDDGKMVEAKPLNEALAPFIGDCVTITIQQKNESDNIEVEGSEELEE